MIGSFKNFERLRYRISKDMKEIATQYQKTSVGMREQISSTTFATVFSAFITEVAFDNSDNGIHVGADIIKLIFLFLIIYVVSYFVYIKLFELIVYIYKLVRKNKINKSMDDLLQYQKDFDNIACDSILLAREYEKEFCTLSYEEQVSTIGMFYYYEILHYLSTACNKTQKLFEYKSKCVRTMNEAEGVDIFRIINILSMMKTLDRFLDEKYEMVCGNDTNKEAIHFQHNLIKEKISDIENSCQNN